MELDRRFIESLKEGDSEAYRQFISFLEKPLINFIYGYIGDRDTAEDIFQDTFVRVVRALHTFKPQYSLKTWVFTIAKNLCLDHLKSKKRKKVVSLESLSKEGAGVAEYLPETRSPREPRDLAETTEQRELLFLALGRLAPIYREILIYRCFSGMGYDEISDILGIPVGTCKFRVHQGIKNLIKIVRGTQT